MKCPIKNFFTCFGSFATEAPFLIASGTDTDVRTANAYETNDYLGKGN